VVTDFFPNILKERLISERFEGAWTPENLDATIPVVERRPPTFSNL